MARPNMQDIAARLDGSTLQVNILSPIDASGLDDGVDVARIIPKIQDFEGSTINVTLNSPGGDPYGALTLYNTLRAHKANVVVTIQGLAAGAAAMLAMAGDTILMAEGSYLVLSNPTGLCIGDSDAQNKMADELDRTASTWATIFAERSGMTQAEVVELMDAETWLDARQAVAQHFAGDRIAADPEQAERIAAHAGTQAFSHYRNVPSALKATLDRQRAAKTAAAPARHNAQEGLENTHRRPLTGERLETGTNTRSERDRLAKRAQTAAAPRNQEEAAEALLRDKQRIRLGILSWRPRLTAKHPEPVALDTLETRRAKVAAMQSQWRALIDEAEASGLSRDRAISQVAAKHEELRLDLIAQANQNCPLSSGHTNQKGIN